MVSHHVKKGDTMSTAHTNDNVKENDEEHVNNFKFNFNTPIVILEKDESKDKQTILEMRMKLENNSNF